MLNLGSHGGDYEEYFRNVTPCNSVEVHRYSVTYYFHLQDQRVVKKCNQKKARNESHARKTNSRHRFTFDPKNVGNIFPQNVGKHDITSQKIVHFVLYFFATWKEIVYANHSCLSQIVWQVTTEI
jgi:hypothetical protein